jgi:RNA polymerase sigma factor (sigma-70 family)
MSPTNPNDLDLTALYREHHEHVQRVVRRKFRDLDETVIEDACAFAWLQLSRVPPAHDNIVGWLILVATNEVLATLGKRSGEVATDALPSVASDESGPLDEAIRREEIEAFAALFATLKPAQRLTLTLFSRGYTYKQIATLTGKTRTWVNRHITEGREALRKEAGLE